MPIISKEEEIIEKIASIYDLLLKERELLEVELTFIRHNFERACNAHIHNGFQEDEWLEIKTIHQSKYNEYEIYCHIIEIITDFRDLYGRFPEYNEMYLTLNQTMIQLAKIEKYETAMIFKPWVDKIKIAILI